MTPASPVLAYTISHGTHSGLAPFVTAARATAGCWFDWAVWLGAPTSDLREEAEALLDHPGGLGIQHLTAWPENRGQHHALREALALARAHGYHWLLRLDPDLSFKTRGWLSAEAKDKRGRLRLGMLERLEWMREHSGDSLYRIVAAPRVVGLRNPLLPIAMLQPVGQPFPAELMDVLGGACRLHPVSLLEGFEPDIYDPVNRGDPQQMALWVREHGGLLVRFPDIRVLHPTDELEAADTPEQADERLYAQWWPFLETAEW